MPKTRSLFPLPSRSPTAMVLVDGTGRTRPPARSPCCRPCAAARSRRCRRSRSPHGEVALAVAVEVADRDVARAADAGHGRARLLGEAAARAAQEDRHAALGAVGGRNIGPAVAVEVGGGDTVRRDAGRQRGTDVLDEIGPGGPRREQDGEGEQQRGLLHRPRPSPIRARDATADPGHRSRVSPSPATPPSSARRARAARPRARPPAPHAARRAGARARARRAAAGRRPRSARRGRRRR